MGRASGLISIWLSFTILLLSAGLVSHVMSIPIILGVAHRDSWLSVILAAPFFLLWIFILFGILKQLHGQRLPDWIEREFGVVPAWIFRLSAIVLVFASGSYTLHDTSKWTVVTYMQQTPMIVIIVIAVVVSMLAAYGGLRTIAMTSSILLPFVILLGYFVSFANTKYKDYSLLFPLLENGWQPVASGMFYTLAGLMELWVILLYQHKLRSRLRWWHLLLLALFMLGMVIGPTIGAITEFGPQEAAKQRHTAFEQWKIVKLGELLQHVDFLSIYQWLCGSFARIAISLYLVTDLLDVRKPFKRGITLGIISICMTVVAIQPWRDDQTLSYLASVHFPVSAIYVSAVTVLLAFAVLIRSKRKEPAVNDSNR
nr:endospore germination permease [Paenibacillus luteus]